MSPDTEVRQYEFLTAIFNTDCKLVLFGKRMEVRKAYQKTSEQLFRLHNALNRFDEKSELSRFNALPAASPFQCSEELWNAFMVAREAFEETDGAFDVTIGPLMDFWRKNPNSSPEEINGELTELLTCVGMDKLLFDDEAHTITKKVNGVKVDFGGLAKGLALDMAKACLLENSVANCYLDFGGNIYQALPDDHPNRDKCAIADMRDADKTAPRVMLNGTAGKFIATSANTYRAISKDSERPIGHIMDPVTGRPAQSQMISATAVADTGWRSDAFSTAVFAKGPALAEKISTNNQNCAFLIASVADEQLLLVGNAITIEE